MEGGVFSMHRSGEDMTDAVWWLWNHALIDYAKAAGMWLLIRLRRDETAPRSPPASQLEPDEMESPTRRSKL